MSGMARFGRWPMADGNTILEPFRLPGWQYALSVKLKHYRNQTILIWKTEEVHRAGAVKAFAPRTVHRGHTRPFCGRPC